MKPEESIVINEFMKRVNKIIESGQTPDLAAIEDEMMRDRRLVPKEVRKEIADALRESAKGRSEIMRVSRNRITQESGSILDALENCISFGELLHARIEAIFGSGLGVLRGKTPRPRPDVVTGATLKCLLVLGIHARSCIIANEVSVLLRNGFPDGADSRLRTLHEHAVVMTLIGNDFTYEVAERYADRAAFEYLHWLRCAKRSFSDGYRRQDPVTRQRIEEDLAATQVAVHEARARWGSMITEQYGWARPILPRASQAKRNITFADLESAAEMDFLRVDYLGENYHVHAGAHAVISAADLDGHIYSLHPAMTDDRMSRAAYRLAMIFGFTSHLLAAAVSKETEEWDGFLLSAEMTRLADRVCEKIAKWNMAHEAESA